MDITPEGDGNFSLSEPFSTFFVRMVLKISLLVEYKYKVQSLVDDVIFKKFLLSKYVCYGLTPLQGLYVFPTGS